MAESTVILTKRGRSADPSIRKLEMAFLDKLAADDALPGLHIEPVIHGLHSSSKMVSSHRVPMCT